MGGEKNQINLQFETEFNKNSFIKLFSQGQSIKNTKSSSKTIIVSQGLIYLRSLTDGLLDNARRDPLENLSNQTLECFADCELLSSGIYIDHLLSKQLSLKFKYAYTHSEQTSGTDKGKDANYTPEHNLKLGVNWISLNGVKAGASLTYLSEMHKDALDYDSGISWMLDISKETINKDIKLYAIAKYDDIQEGYLYILGANYRF